MAAALGRLLLDSAAPPSSLSPLQLQLALGQLTLLLPTLGEGAGPALLSLRSALASPPLPADAASLLPPLPRRLLALCRHGSYGVRVEAAVALASLVRVRLVNRWWLSLPSGLSKHTNAHNHQPKRNSTQ